MGDFVPFERKKCRSARNTDAGLLVPARAEMLEGSLSTIKTVLFADERLGVQTLISRRIFKNNVIKMWLKKKSLYFSALASQFI